MRTAALLLHATAAVVALVLGVVLLRQAGAHHPPVGFRWYYARSWSWPRRSWSPSSWTGTACRRSRPGWPSSRLCVLAVTMVWEADRARRFLRRAPAAMSPARSGAYVEAVGFTVIALLDGFAIITALDLGAPDGWSRPSGSSWSSSPDRSSRPSGCGRRREPGDGEGGRYWDRTSDLLGVNEALYH